MLENGCAFTAAFAAGNNKQNDNAELGVYRNNWYMLRTYCDHFKGAGEGDWYNLGQQLQLVIFSCPFPLSKFVMMMDANFLQPTVMMSA